MTKIWNKAKQYRKQKSLIYVTFVTVHTIWFVIFIHTYKTESPGKTSHKVSQEPQGSYKDDNYVFDTYYTYL